MMLATPGGGTVSECESESDPGQTLKHVTLILPLRAISSNPDCDTTFALSSSPSWDPSKSFHMMTGIVAYVRR